MICRLLCGSKRGLMLVWAFAGKVNMRILFYTSTINERTHKMFSKLHSMVSEDHVFFTDQMEAFKDALVKYRTVDPVVMIHVSSVTDVAEIKELGVILEDRFLIITTETNNKEMIRCCRRLYPRILSYPDETLWIVSAVIEKRLARLGYDPMILAGKFN